MSHAGRLANGYLIMHNGLRVRPDSYYNYAALRMIQRNGGVHEPQEERAFQEVLAYIPAHATMLELGSYWAFYSMWFCQRVAAARCIMVEADAENMRVGQKHFEANGFTGAFIHAAAGEQKSSADQRGLATISVDSLMEDHAIEHLDLLHSDIQGHELEMLHGSRRALAAGRIGFAFVSTHSDKLHEECLAVLRGYSMRVIAEHTRAESYSGDGLIVARHPKWSGPSTIPISRRGKESGEPSAGTAGRRKSANAASGAQ